MISQIDRLALLNQADLEYQIHNDRVATNARRGQSNVVKKMLNSEQAEMVTDYYKIYGEPIETDEGTKKIYVRPDIELKLEKIDGPIVSDREIEVEYQKVKDDLIIAEEEQFRKQIAEFTTSFNIYFKRETQALENKILALEEELEQRRYELEEELKDSGLVFKRKEIIFELSPIKEELKKKKNELKKLEDELNKYYVLKVDEIKEEITNKTKFFQVQIENEFTMVKEENENKRQIEKSNAAQIDFYRQQLQDLNSGLNIDAKQPYETNEEYYQRLENLAVADYPEYYLQDASTQINKLFRKKLQEIISKPVDVNTVFNNIEELGRAEKKNVLLKQWPIIKAEFIKTFGENNKFVKPDDILEFFKLFYSTNEQGETKIVFDRQQSDKIKGSDTVQKGKLIIKPDLINHQVKIKNRLTDKDIYFRLVDKNDVLHLLYSYSGQPGSFEEFNKKDKGAFNKIIQKFTGIDRTDIALLYNPEADYSKVIFNVDSFINYILNTLNITPYPFKINQGLNIIRNPDITETAGKLGMGNESLDKIAQLGDVFIYLKKLYYDNILSVLNKHHNQFQGFKTVKVSEKFVQIIMNLLNGVHPTNQILSTLSDKEKHIYDRLITIANLHKKVTNSTDNTIDKLKKRMKLIEAEIEIGNNNPELKTELENILLTLKDLKVITMVQVKQYLKQLI